MSIFDNINKYENNNALVTENEEIITYKTLLQFSKNISKNIKSRCLVFLLCGNNLESISGYLGFFCFFSGPFPGCFGLFRVILGFFGLFWVF